MTNFENKLFAIPTFINLYFINIKKKKVNLQKIQYRVVPFAIYSKNFRFLNTESHAFSYLKIK